MRNQFDEPATFDPDDLPQEFGEGRDFYGYNYGDYRDYEGRDPDAGYEEGRGPDWDDEEPQWRYGERGGRGDEGSDIRGAEGREYRNYAGGYEGFYSEESGWGGADEYESWRWESLESWEPVGEWSMRHAHEYEHPGLGRRRARVRARRHGPPHHAGPGRHHRHRPPHPSHAVNEQRGPEQPRVAPTGGFRGVAPKGYVRSDDAIFEDVCALLEDAEVDPSNVTVSVDAREVVLSGTVDDRWAKRYVEDLAYSVRGVNDVINKLRVEPPGAEDGATLVAPESRAREDVPDPR